MSNHVGILHWSLWNSSEVMDLNRLSNVPCIANFRGPLPIFFLILSHKLNFLVSCFVVSTILFQLQYFSSHRLRLNFGNISFQNWHLKSSYLGLNFETLKFSSLGLNFGNWNIQNSSHCFNLFIVTQKIQVLVLKCEPGLADLCVVYSLVFEW